VRNSTEHKTAYIFIFMNTPLKKSRSAHNIQIQCNPAHMNMQTVISDVSVLSFIFIR